MEFKDVLNEYLDIVKCSSKELAIQTGISESAISRYRSGERTPKEDSKQLKEISLVIEKMINENNVCCDYDESVYEKLSKCIKGKDSFDYNSFSNSFNKLINVLKININEMSKYIVFDPSHISRIRYCKTKPSDPIAFCEKVANYIVFKHSNQDKSNICTFFGISSSEGLNDKDLFNLIFEYLTSNNVKNSDDQIEIFLTRLDKFDLNDYISAISFDKLKVPSIPFYKAKSKKYFGLDMMKKGELDFFKATVLSRCNDDIFMCSDMPMEDMAEYIDFGKKWMFGIAMCLKKGLHLNIIHNLDRPFNEMMLGLESWIPIYMTGQISPFYLREVKNSVHQHLNYVSGEYALCGECIKDHHDDGMYYLATNSKEVQYYRRKAKFLLSKSFPLMEIYKEKDFDVFNVFLSDDLKIKTNRKRILNSLPLFTISDELLNSILIRNNVSKKDMKLIKEYKKLEEDSMSAKLNNGKVIDIIYEYNENEFLKNDIYLPLENIFYSKKITYTYDEYKKHLDMTINYKNSNYKIKFNNYKTFKNISIEIVHGKYIIISKNMNPIIHFVMKHPKLVDSFENFNPLVKEK